MKKKLTGLILKMAIKAFLTALPILCIAAVLFSFMSGLEQKDEYDENYAGEAQSEDVLINQIMTDGYDSDNYGEFMLTQKDLLTLLLEVKKTKQYHATDYYYEYYWETWCVCSYEVPYTYTEVNTLTGETEEKTGWTEVDTEWYTEYDESVLPNPHRNVVWGWHSGYQRTDGWARKGQEKHLRESYKEEPLRIDNTEYELEGEYSVDWQSIYAMAVMASQETESYWWEDYENPVESEKIQYRIDEDKLDDIIDVFRYKFTYAWDGATHKNMKEKDNWVDIGESFLNDDGTLSDETSDMLKELYGDDFRYNQVEKKWQVNLVTSYTPSEANLSWPELEKLTYLVESNGDWGITSNGTSVYKRTLRKIPETGLLGVANAYMSKSMHAETNTVHCAGKEKYKYYEAGCTPENGGAGDTNLNMSCRYQNNKQYNGGIYQCDPVLFYKTACTLVNQFDWEYFIMILETLPDNEEVLEKYNEMWEQYKNGEDIYRDLREDEYKPIVFGSSRGDKFAEDGNYYLPDVDQYASDEETTRTLNESDNLTLEQIKTILESYPAIAGKTNSLLRDSTVAEYIYKFQQDYPQASVLGLLAIAGCESAWGTSSLCNDYWNFIGWGAVDSNPRGGEAATGNFKAQSSCIGEALYKCFQKIYLNFITGSYSQDSYHTMRWNNNVHQYCTSLTWEFTNAANRRSLEEFLGTGATTVVGEAGTICSEFVSPTGGSGTVTSHFGSRTQISTANGGSSTNHKGVDIGGLGAGHAVYAAYAGTVCEAYKSGSTGSWIVKINHANGVSTRYIHQTNVCVSVGDHVEAGQKICEVAPTDRASSGPHLHFEIFINGTQVDPEKYMSF